MKNLKTIIILTAITLTSVGCVNNSNITGNEDDGRKIEGIGDVITQTVSLPSFSNISNSIPANINVTVGSPQEIVVRAQQNIIDVMVFKVEDSEFRLDFEEDITGIASKGIEVDIKLLKLTE